MSTLAPCARRLPARGVWRTTIPLLFVDETCLTVPTRQCARTIRALAFASRFPTTWGTTQTVGGSDPPKPTTETGVWWPILVPSPSWPLLLPPQHLTSPALVSAQLYWPLAASPTTPLASRETSPAM